MTGGIASETTVTGSSTWRQRCCTASRKAAAASSVEPPRAEGAQDRQQGFGRGLHPVAGNVIVRRLEHHGGQPDAAEARICSRLGLYLSLPMHSSPGCLFNKCLNSDFINPLNPPILGEMFLLRGALAPLRHLISTSPFEPIRQLPNQEGVTLD